MAKSLGCLWALFVLERACKLRQGDVLVELIDRHGFDPSTLHGRPGDVGTIYRSNTRCAPKVPYNSQLLAMRMAGRLRREHAEAS